MSALHGYLQRTAAARPHAAAIEADRQSISYGELHALAKSICERLTMLGANRGDRIGVYLPKSIDAVAAMHGIMMSGAAYVPVDPSAPAVRNASIHHDCSVRIVIVHAKFEAAYRQAFGVLGRIPTLIVVPEVERGFGMREAVDAAKSGAQFAQGFDPNPDDLAYILYTSGSTGKPKGVMLTHRNATSFIDWCSEVFAPGSADRCSSHAPFHFDLSVLDIYLTMKHGATLVLVPEATGKDPVALAPFIAAQRISVWYSAPSILGLLAHFGKLAQYDLSPLRLVLFAGEVFPVKHLRALKTLLPAPVYFNLYGPTETNVCTYYRIPDTIPADRTTPYPIGRTCAHLQTTVIDDTGNT
ncbi:MAG: AMP-binding protein, partial [Gammaproteobacteria bacterium]|nr:AMP-binding protein [Gammaproteobacteria bacterium]